jgi:hypothetical protein
MATANRAVSAGAVSAERVRHILAPLVAFRRTSSHQPEIPKEGP